MPDFAWPADTLFMLRDKTISQNTSDELLWIIVK